MWPSTTAGCAANNKTESTTNDINIYTLDFSDTTQEHAEGGLAMPSDWDAGTITAQFYWTATGTSTNDVDWGLQAVSMGDLHTIDGTDFGTAQTVGDAHAATALQMQITAATAAITVAGTPAAGEYVAFRVFRDVANDNLAVDALLIGVMVNYTRV